MSDERKRPELTRQRSVKFIISSDNAGASAESGSSSEDESGLAQGSSRFRVTKVKVEVTPERRSSNGSRKASEDESWSSTRRPSTFDTYNECQKTFGRNTLETLPHIDHYRSLFNAEGGIRQRPTLMELHEQEELDRILEEEQNPSDVKKSTDSEQPIKAVVKFGWIKGVFVRCVLNIFGVMLFLRLSWVVAQAGIGLATVIILLASAVTTLTALSMSAICSNGEVKGGGAYYMISRSLGPEFGGAIGVVFSIANAVAAAMYIVGFAETIRDILASHDCLIVDEVNDVRIIGLITALFILGVAVAGLSWESRAQLVLLAILVIAIGDFMIGSFLPTSKPYQEKGFSGYRVSVFKTNFAPDFRNGHSLFSVFGIFFPAATGILAGANISGDLKNAQSAIPKGTLLAILVTTLTYLSLAWMVGSCVVRDASGPNLEILLTAGFENITENATLGVTFFGETTTTSASAMHFDSEENVTLLLSETVDFNLSLVLLHENSTTNDTRTCSPGKCKYGSHNSMQVMQMVSLFGPITIAGIVSATLSSALASLVSAPRVFQAVCKDKIFPCIHVFAKGYGENDEPRRAYALAFCLCLACVSIGDLNAIAPLISNFFLMSYLLINYSCVDASLSRSPGWRPAFRFYSLWLSLAGALLCLSVMFVINWWTALLTIGLIIVLYFYVHYRKPDINWGSSTQAHVYRNALQYSQKLALILEHVKNYRPQVLALTGFPSDRPAMVDFCASITKNISLMICGQVIQSDPAEELKSIQVISRVAYLWLRMKKSKAFHSVIISKSFRPGVQALMQSVGIGKLKPNMMIIGFKIDWQTAPSEDVEEYFGIIHDAFDLRYSIGILRLKDGLYIPGSSQNIFEENVADGGSSLPNSAAASPSCKPGQIASPTSDTTVLTELGAPAEPEVVIPAEADDRNRKELNKEGQTSQDTMSESEESEKDDDDKDAHKYHHHHHLHLEKLHAFDECEKYVTQFSHNQKKSGFIDVWWMFDDGGLTLLVPYIMTTKKLWSDCKLRVFMAGSKKDSFDRDQRHVALLLHKFRIQYASITVVTDITKRPQPESLKEFENMIREWRLNKEEAETEQSFPWKITDNELATQKHKTYRHIRLRELLREHSSEATLIVMTLPMPKKGLCSAGLYMSWLDVLSRDMPPMLMLRGNQENVLTYYS